MRAAAQGHMPASTSARKAAAGPGRRAAAGPGRRARAVCARAAAGRGRREALAAGVGLPLAGAAWSPREARAEGGEAASAYDFSVTLDGEPVSLSQYRGKVSLIMNIASE